MDELYVTHIDESCKSLMQEKMEGMAVVVGSNLCVSWKEKGPKTEHSYLYMYEYTYVQVSQVFACGEVMSHTGMSCVTYMHEHICASAKNPFRPPHS